MTSFISSFKVRATATATSAGRPAGKLLLSVLAALAAVGVIELAARATSSRAPGQTADSVAALMKQLPDSRIKGREIGNQMIAHNVALFSRHSDPASVKEAFVGTSRSKVLRPQALGMQGAVNGSGNSYNEISYGLLLQAEALRLQFPNLRRVWFEASLLMRRPDRLIVEPDHEKYLPLLREIAPLRAGLPNSEAFFAKLQERSQQAGAQPKGLSLLSQRGHWRISSFLGQPVESSDGSIAVTEDDYLKALAPNGERKNMAGPGPKPADRPTQVTNEHIKVQRLRKTVSWAPWDGLYDMVPRWAQKHGIEIVLFQPPVRADLYRFQLENGLSLHQADLHRISREYGVPFIDLNRPELGWMDDASLFSDEDHLETCKGVVLLQAALKEGGRLAAQGVSMPMLTRESIEKLAKSTLARCDAPGR